MRERSNLQRIYGMPAILVILTGVGLISALFANGVWDTVSWIALSTIIAVLAWFVLRPAHSRQDQGISAEVSRQTE